MPSLIRTANLACRSVNARSLTTSTLRYASAATAAAPAESTQNSTVNSGVKPRSYTRRTAVPASASASASAPRARSSIPSRSAATSPAPASRTVVGISDVEPIASTAAEQEEDVSNSDYSAFADIDDYAHLSPPPPSSASASRSRARRPPPTSNSSETPAIQPTPSPPMTSLPNGPSTLPLVSHSPASTVFSGTGSGAGAGAGVGAGSAALRNPDIQGEVSAPAGSDWSTSFQGLSERPFAKEVAVELLRPLEADDIEMKPDGLLYLPEIKYRRTLNAAFGPGGWGLAPRGETSVGPKVVSREWGLVCLGRLVSVARGEQEYFDPSGIATATEACKSNALMRCCKDLGIASELWDPKFIREFKAKHCEEVFVEHVVNKKKRKLWRKKGSKFEYPYKET